MTERISVGAQMVLQRMVTAEREERFEDAEIVQDHLDVWVGNRRTSARVVLELLRTCLIRDVGKEGHVHRYGLNEDGRRAAHDPTWRPPEIRGLVR